MIQVESVAMWAALIAYALSSVAFIVAFAFGRPATERLGWWMGVAGLVAHATGIAARWVHTGHGPYLGFYEVASLMAFIAVVLCIVLSARYPGLVISGVVVLPIALLILGGSMLASREAESVSGSLASIWLIVHVVFANLAFGSYVAGFVLSTAYLMREHGRERGRISRLVSRFPEQVVIDELTYRFVGAGFLFQGVMIASGAIWANEAWGRYWAWDPMETWSLVAWAIYALYLHLRLTMGWSGRRAAWVAVASLPIIVFSLLGVPLVYDSIHGAYLYT